MIYLAPLQGFTDFVYRKAYHRVFGGIDAYFIPYISVKNNCIPKKYMKEILPENNLQGKVVPQVLAGDGAEIKQMGELLSDLGYSEINLNLGCPYPMVTNRGKGAGLLALTDAIEEILGSHFSNSSTQLSVKIRAGFHSEKDIEKVFPILNKYPLTEIILHPRIASQMYTGLVNDKAFEYATINAKHPLVFNGDVFTREDYLKRKEQFPSTKNWMLGRGILMNPFLPQEIQGISTSQTQKKEKLMLFHEVMLQEYLSVMDNEGNALNKMHQFWVYFSHCFEEQRKTLKYIKKAKNITKFLAEVNSIFMCF